MNYLAHLFLSAGETELMVGNFIADGVKGSNYKNYPEKVSRGIIMHRSTDFYSDTHPVYLRSVHNLASEHGKFSGIIADMLYDYLLATHWKDFSNEGLDKFCKKTYVVLRSFQDSMPEKCQVTLNYMIKYNWLESYKTLEGIERALKGLSGRMKYYYPMHNSIKPIRNDIEVFQKDFYEFFPLLIEHVKQFR